MTLLDASVEQLAQDRYVAERDGLAFTIIEGDMADLSALADDAFDLIFNPPSTMFVPHLQPVWQECNRVLRPGGTLMTGFINPDEFVFDADALDNEGAFVVRHSLPYVEYDTLVAAEREERRQAKAMFHFSHTMESQLGGILDAGFVITGFYEDRRPRPTATGFGITCPASSWSAPTKEPSSDACRLRFHAKSLAIGGLPGDAALEVGAPDRPPSPTSPVGSRVDLLHRGSGRSAGAVDGDCEGGTDLAHANLGQPSQPLDEDGDRDAFDRVEVHRRAKRHRVVTRFEHHLARKPADGRRAGSHEGAAMPWDDHVAGQDNDRSATDPGHLAPPDLPPGRVESHDAPAARRNVARSPHSSGSSSGCSS